MGLRSKLTLNYIVQFLTALLFFFAVLIVIHHATAGNTEEMHQAINWTIWTSIVFGYSVLYSVSRFKNSSYEKYIEALENYRKSSDAYRNMLEERTSIKNEIIEELEKKIKIFEEYEKSVASSLDEIKGEFSKINKAEKFNGGEGSHVEAQNSKSKNTKRIYKAKSK